jgi:hypothetical protein
LGKGLHSFGHGDGPQQPHNQLPRALRTSRRTIEPSPRACSCPQQKPQLKLRPTTRRDSHLGRLRKANLLTGRTSSFVCQCTHYCQPIRP